MLGELRILHLLMSLSAGMVFGLSGCASNPPDVASLPGGAACLDDSQRCIAIRQARLKTFQADPKRSWVFAQEPRRHYATGVKLFAYSTARRKLSCRELAHGVQETRSARGWLQQAQPGITSEQLLRARMLNDEVGGQLNKVVRRKCLRTG